MRYRFIILVAAVCGLMSVTDIKAQVTISPEDEAFFKSLFPQKEGDNWADTYYQDKFKNRLSFHANVVDWVLTMPSAGIEFDLNNKFVFDEHKKRTWKTNRTLLLFGKYNGHTKHTVAPKFVFDVAAVRLEFRKYWRTGKVGLNNNYHEDYRTMDLHKPDTLWRKVKTTDEFGDTIVKREAYYSSKDSARINEGKEFEGDPNRGRFSNMYENARRLASTRTIENARNWRAYYLGAFAGWDKYSWCLSKKGEQGTLLSVGATFGWSVPLLATHDKDYGLDLDLGLNVGVPAAKYEGYKYVDVDNNAYYVHDGRSKNDGWTINPKYILRDIHVALVYRFRSISRKVSLAIVDDYQKRIDAWNERQRKMSEEKRLIEEEWQRRLEEQKRTDKHNTDSLSWYNWQRKEYLVAMKELYPDRPWQTRQDSIDYIRLVLGIDTVDYVRVKAREDRLKKMQEDMLRDSLDWIKRVAERDSLGKAKIEQRKQKRAERDSLDKRNAFMKDSIAHVKDSLDQIRRDSIGAVRDSAQKVKDAARDSIQAIKNAQRDSLQKIRDDERRARLAEKKALQDERDAEEAKRKAEQKLRQDSIDAERRKQRIEQEMERKQREFDAGVNKDKRKEEQEARKQARERDKEEEAEARRIEQEAQKRARENEKRMRAQEAENRKQREAEEQEELKAEAEKKKAEADAMKEKKAQEAEAKKAEADAKKQADKEARDAERAKKEAEKAEADAKKQADKEAKDAERAKREAEKAEADAKKQAEREAKEAAKRAEQERKAAEKEAAKAAKEAKTEE